MGFYENEEEVLALTHFANAYLIRGTPGLYGRFSSGAYHIYFVLMERQWRALWETKR